MKAENYKKAKIYALKSPNSDLMYIGSTCTDLNIRLKGHIYAYNTYQKIKHQYLTSFKIIECGEPYIELLKDCPSLYKHQVLAEEGAFIRLNQDKTVNKRLENLTYEERALYAKIYYRRYNQTNKEKISIQKKKYYQENKDKVKTRNLNNYYKNKNNN